MTISQSTASRATPADVFALVDQPLAVLEEDPACVSEVERTGRAVHELRIYARFKPSDCTTHMRSRRTKCLGSTCETSGARDGHKFFDSIPACDHPTTAAIISKQVRCFA